MVRPRFQQSLRSPILFQAEIGVPNRDRFDGQLRPVRVWRRAPAPRALAGPPLIVRKPFNWGSLGQSPGGVLAAAADVARTSIVAKAKRSKAVDRKAKTVAT